MTRIFSILLLALAALTVNAAEPDITFEELTFDFGTIAEDGGPVKHEFKFTNTGDAPLVIVSVTNGGCGCPRPEYPKQPIAPGKTGVITIKFNPTGRRGEFNRQVQVKTNAAKSKRVKLKFSGSIIP